MVCYLCGTPASAFCRGCSRYVCTRHTKYTSACGADCVRCVEKAANKTPSSLTFGEQCEVDSGRYRCFSCHAATTRDMVCRKCGRHFCDSHGRVDQMRASGGIHRWIRCMEHPRKLAKQKFWLRKPGPLDEEQYEPCDNLIDDS